MNKELLYTLIYLVTVVFLVVVIRSKDFQMILWIIADLIDTMDNVCRPLMMF